MPRHLIAAVDDDTAFLDLVANIFAEEGFATLMLRESRTAYEEIKTAQPSLVMLDLLMEHPDSGFRVLSALRLDPVTKRIPVIICSAATQLLHDNEQRLRGQKCDLLFKPFDLDELLTMVRRNLTIA